MTFDSSTYCPHISPHQDTPSKTESLAGKLTAPARNKRTQPTETSNENCNDIQIRDWENEAGIDAHSVSGVSGNRSLVTVSALTTHIKNAEELFKHGDYDGACLELEAATQRFAQYKEKINYAFDTSIAKLSTPTNRAARPHPKALHLVRLRRKISA